MVNETNNMKIDETIIIWYMVLLFLLRLNWSSIIKK